MKKKITRWLALLMAVAMLTTSAIYTSGIATVSESALKAAEEQLAAEGKAEAVTSETEVAAPEVTQPEVTQPEPAQVQEPVVVAPAEQPAPAPQQTEPVQPSETPAEEAPAEVKYTLKLHKPEIEGGVIQTWTTGEKTENTYGFEEEVTENTIYNIEVTAAEKYEVEKITDQYENVVEPKEVNENVYLYEIPVTNNIELKITYKEIEEDPADTPENDEKKEDTDSEEKEPVTEEEPEEEQDASETPGVKFEDEAGGITVIVTAPEEAFPEGTVMKVKAVSDDEAKAAAKKVAGKDAEVTSAKAVDITFYNKKGKEIQPKVPVKVELLNTGVEGEEKGVFRKNADNSVEKIASGAESSTGEVFEAEHFTVYGSFATEQKSSKESSEEGYIATFDGLNITLHDVPGLGDLSAYCYNANAAYPNGSVRYKMPVKYSGQEGKDETAVRNLIYAGDPFDGLGIRKIAANNSDFKISTQDALWGLLEGNPIYIQGPVSSAIYNAAKSNNIPVPGKLVVDNENISFKEQQVSTNSGYKWIYITEPISLSGYTGEYVLSLPEGIRAYDTQGVERNKFSTIESFYLQADSEEALVDLIAGNQLTMSASYSYTYPGEIYYAEAINPVNVEKSFQNLLCYTTATASDAVRFSADATISPREGYHIYYTINGDTDTIVNEIEFSEARVENFLAKYEEGKEEYTSNSKLQEYCDGNGLDYTKYTWDGTERYANGNKAIYLNFNTSETVKVIFDAQGGEGDFTTEVTLPYGGNLPEKETKDRNPKKTHYDFTGWYTASEAGDKVTYLNRVVKDTTLYAQYTPAQYNLTVRIDGKVNEDYAQIAGYQESFEKATYEIPDGYYITEVSITGGSDGTKIKYTSDDKELGEYAKEFMLPSIDKVTSDIEGDCVVEIKTAQLKNMTVGADNVVKTYDGKTYGIEAKISGTAPAGAKIHYYNTKTKKYDLEESPVYKDVKLGKGGKIVSYSVKFKATAPGYNAAEGQATVLINPRTLSVKADDKNKNYNDTDPKLTYKETKPEAQLVDGEVPGYKGALKRESGEDVGAYPIKQGNLQLKNSGKFKAANYKLDFKEGSLIIKGKLDLVTENYTGIYDGQYHQLPAATATASEPGVVPTIEYSLDKSTWEETIPERKDVTVNEENGKKVIYVRASVKDSEYYEPVTEDASFTITQATLTVTADNKSISYGSEIGQLTGTITGFIEGDDEENAIESGSPVFTTDAKKNSDAGSYDIITDAGGLKSVNDNYLFEEVNGLLTIIKAENVLQITAEGSTSVYDSENHTLQSFEVKGINDTELASWNGKKLEVSDKATKIQYRIGDSEEWIDTLPEFADAGTYPVTVKAENKNYAEPVETQVNVEITKRPVTVQVNNSQKKFNEPDPAFDGYVEDEGADSGFTGKDADLVDFAYSRTNADVNDVGSYGGVLTAEVGWNTVNENNYDVRIIPGNFEIIPLEDLTFIPGTVRQTYNGDSLAATAASDEGAKIEYSMDGSEWKNTIEQTDVPDSDDHTYYVHVRASKDGYTTKQSDPNDVNTMAKIIIVPANIKVTSPNQTIAFEEKGSLELTYSNAGAVKKEVPGFKGSLALEKEIDKIGEYQITQNDLVLADNKDTGFKKSNYVLSADLGKVTVTGTLTLKAENYEGLYDGSAHGVEITDLSSSDGTEVEVQYSLDGATWQQEEITYQDVPGNVTDTYNFYVRPYVEGYPEAGGTPVQVIIHPAVIAVTPNSFEVAFTDADKEEKLNNLTYKFEMQDDKGEEYATGETPQFDGSLRKADGDRVGEYEIAKGSLALKDSEDQTFKKGNYILKVEEGSVRITGSLHLNLTAYNADYDGKRHTIETIASIDDGREELLIQYSEDGRNWSTEEVFRKNVTDKPVEVFVKVEAKDNKNYKAVKDSANIIISKVPLVIKANDVNDIIFGAAIPALSGSYVSGLVGGDTLSDALTNANGLADGSYTTDAKAGSPVGPYDIIAAQGNLASHNYELSFQPGILNIVQAVNLSVTAKGNEVTYDAQQHTLSDVQYTGGEATTLEYSTDGGATWQPELPKFTEAGEYPVTVKAENPNYSNTPTAEATVIIHPKDVTIQVADATKTFGSDDPVFTGRVDGLIDREHLGTIVYVRDEADKGKEEVGDDITLTATYKDNKNYNVKVIPGKLEITPVGKLNITVTDIDITYDGDEYGVAVSPTPGSTPLYSTDGENWSEIPPVFTEVGEYEVSVKAVQDGYTDSDAVTGKVTIRPREIVITAASAEKTYDGTPLVSTSAFLTSGTLAEGETITSITVNGSQTEVGSSPNVASDVVVMNQDKNVTGNYKAEYAEGTLTVREGQAAVIPPLTPITPPSPTTPVPPLTPTSADFTNTTITPTVTEPVADVNAPVQAAGTDNGYDLTEVADNKTPLANMDLDDHDCCILHFLLMLAMLLVTILYTRSMKKRQKRAFELQEEYELELIRRDLEKYEEDSESKHIA